jgi:hypothetical protein
MYAEKYQCEPTIDLVEYFDGLLCKPIYDK